MSIMDMISGGEQKTEDRTGQTVGEGQQKPEATDGLMDKIGSVTGSGAAQGEREKKEGGGFMDKVSGLAGGGKQGEKNEDGLDKAVDFVQERVLSQGPQDNESAAEQAKDEAISDYIRSQYKDRTGKEFPIEDKDKKYGV